MTVEIITLFGFAFAAAALAAAVAYELRMDVLYGPYIEGCRERQAHLSAERVWQPVQVAADRFRWKTRNLVYLASVFAC